MPAGDYYTEEDALGSRSPGLEAIVVNPKPEEEPPPIVTQPFVSSPTSRNRKKSKPRKHRPTQGDWVLIREMAPQRPDIAHAVSQVALNSSSETEASDEEMQDPPSDRPVTAPMKEMLAPNTARSDSLADANGNFDHGGLVAERRESHTSHASSTGSVLHSVASNTSTTGSTNGSSLNYTSPRPVTNLSLIHI